MQHALAAQRRGAIADAKHLSTAVLRIDPTNAASLRQSCHHRRPAGRSRPAPNGCFAREIKLRPDIRRAITILDRLLQQQGRLADAIAAHRAGRKTQSELCRSPSRARQCPEAQRRFDEATAWSYRRRDQGERGYPEAHNNIGVLLQMQGKLAEAASAYRRGGGGAARLLRRLSSISASFCHDLSGLSGAEKAYRRAHP